jgi:hypothetical protein
VRPRAGRGPRARRGARGAAARLAGPRRRPPGGAPRGGGRGGRDLRRAAPPPPRWGRRAGPRRRRGGPSPLAPHALDVADPGRAPLLLVDADDRHLPALRRRSRRRREAYAARGWLAPGADPVAAAVGRFLARRPRRLP